jgi:hypothetical protein
VVSRNPVKRLVATMILSLLLSAATPAWADEKLVLIVSADSTIEQFDSSTVRKLFLGLTVDSKGTRLRPLLNESEPQLKEIFLQNIVAMSDSTYDRYVLQLSLQRGSKQPVAYHSNAQLISAVAADAAAVSYAWARDVEHDARIRILRVVWHD